jgi:hypothetical protein
VTNALLRIPQAGWRTLAALILVVGAFVPTVRQPEITAGSVAKNLAILSVVLLMAYWFIRIAFGFVFGLLAAFSDRFARALIVFFLFGNLLACIPLLIQPLLSAAPINDSAAYAGVPACVLGLVYLLRQQQLKPPAA